ncbi:S9 family peptidase [Streptosporangium fragile]|uniref:S9 family peptidase n=1 Tax=Streptosporangium fragile TaxID=46186 RepID=UPI0031EAAB18
MKDIAKTALPLPAAADYRDEAAWWADGPGGKARLPHWCNDSSGVGTFPVRLYAATGDTRFREAAAPPGADPLPNARRFGFRFSGRGRYIACLTGQGHHRLAPELWDLTGPAPQRRGLPTRDGETSWTPPVPTDDGDLLLCRTDRDFTRLLLVAPAPGGDSVHGADAEEHELCALRSRGLRLVPCPVAGTAALMFEASADRRTTVWRVSGRAEPPELITKLPGPVSGGVWLDDTGGRFALTSQEPGTARTLTLDLSRGTLAPLGGPARDEHLLLAAPRTGTLLTAAMRDGAYRLGLRHLDGEGPTAFPERLNSIEGIVTPLALDPTGRHLALAVTRGARSHLFLHDLADDTTGEVGLPPGVLYPAAHWSAVGLHLIHSAPDRPLGVVTVPEPSRPRILSAPEDHRVRWAPARTRDYDGPVGRIEAVVYGDPAAGGQVVLALHGGPEAAWQLDFDPLFQCLAAAGIAVVAPNQRGSTGYGPAHRDAIHGAWGGPDLADILHLGRALAAARGPDRERPMLYGASYGAYLALLAAAAQPDLWARAAVVAPFLSGRKLYDDGPDSVCNLIDRLRGREEIHDELGPRDLLRLADRMLLPLLIVHGEQDPLIPVTHSRRLIDRLREGEHRDGADLTYLEVPGAGHDPLSETGGHLILDHVADFLRTGPSTSPKNR